MSFSSVSLRGSAFPGSFFQDLLTGRLGALPISVLFMFTTNREVKSGVVLSEYSYSRFLCWAQMKWETGI